MANLHIMAGADETPTKLVIRRIGPADLRDALKKGFDDFLAMPSHLIFLCLIYPVACVVLATTNAFYLLYPLASGFALLGPFAAIGLYEISRRRELGLDTSWRHAFDVLWSPAIPSILALGILLTIIFLCWLTTAEILYGRLFGEDPPESYWSFLQEVLTTPHGWALAVLGNATGFVFAVAVLSISVVSFPLLIDRDVGAAAAIQTSINAVLTNPVMMALWGLIVTALLVMGFVTLLVGLAIVMPVLGHSTWHLYRKIVGPGLPAPAA
ncbi:Uncharacterized membrane protein [Rhizobiales bacterium GAS191]|jgi:uncharacterized membrane protein|nr:Uncharacterized membrane protein [Rhizobiales bacterium GAS113]SED87721.1 Uncharacterized membrane protein [Rhizobiales bacterium GAS188]SEE61969.1 Uncharacterized membrane protein [Rhizobiales bacterium GAS191]